MSSRPPSARDGALAQLAAEAARFTAPAAAAPTAPRPVALAPAARPAPAAAPQPVAGRGGPAGYVPVAVAPERGNTRPVVPVDGRIHMRMAQATVAALDAVVAAWRAGDPTGLRDLERATLIRVGIAMVLTDVAANGTGGAVGEAVRAALDPAVRHTDAPLPDLGRWLREAPGPAADARAAGRPAGAAPG